ncbi:MFS family permease [Actinoplanes octamycinicus]|uniref:MFS family permease n=1 Tax=Actinoplanes octamycinicus TaxID=135948 RepID=A0A7W7M812_9ACTN|nr:MFS transporter [Actinoplanes octamycinicus]MBB4740447.1 MFS family permease [Actinoplanes octamycinicus]GIE59708.1 MFS transporter [Actinoplanes octamycinicus]
MLTVLRDPGFLRLSASYAASASASALLPTALTLAVIDQLGGVRALGLVLGARTLGFIAGVLPAGVIADRLPRHRVMAWASGIRAVATVVTLAFFHLPVAFVCASVFFVGAGEGVFRTAYQALVGERVPEPDRPAANAVTTVVMRVTLVVGPGLATLLYTQLSLVVCLLAGAVLWAGSALLAVVVRGAPRTAARPGAGAATEFRVGLAEARRHRWFLAGLAALAVWLTLAYSVQQLQLPVVSAARFGGYALVGAVLGAYSVGAILGAVLMARWQPRQLGLVAFLGLGLYGLVPISLALSSTPVLIAAAYLVGGIGIEVFNVPWFTAIQREVPTDKLARVSALDFLVSYGMSPIGLVLLPVAGDAWGAGVTLVLAGGATTLACLAALLVPGARRFHDPLVRRADPTRQRVAA